MNVPKLRFKEFDEEWEEQKLKEISFLTDGTHSTPKYTSKGVPFWSVETITTNASVKYISNEEHTELIKRCKPEFGDILITRISSGINSLGVPKLVNWKEEFSIYVSVGLIKPKDIIEPKYLVSYIESPNYKREFLSKSLLTATPKKINMSDLGETKVTLPLLEEQKKIGNFFEILNKKIQLQQQKIDLLQEQKKGYMQKIFSRELSFKEYNNMWSEKNLEEVADFYDNLRIPITSADRIKGSTPYYGANGIQDYVEGYTHKGEFVLIAEDGANDFFDYPVNYVYGEIWVNNHAHVLKGKAGELDNLFLTYRIKSMNLYPWLVGGGRAKLNGEVLKKIPILIPSYNEQQRIGQFFASLDKKIQFQTEKLNILQKQKYGFMQQMFI